MYIIQDWACNTLQYNGKFNFGRYGACTGSPKEFKTFDDAVEYIDANLDDQREDIHVVQLLGKRFHNPRI